MAKRRFRSRRRFSRIRRRRGFRSKRLVRAIKRTVRRMQEIKYAVFSFINSNPIDSSLGNIVNITPAFDQGVDKNQRIGYNLQYKYLQVRYRLVAQSSTNSTSMNVRHIIFQSRTNVNTLLSDQKTQPIFNVGGSNAYLSSINNSYCRVLSDKTTTMGIFPNNQNAQLPSNFRFKKKIRIHNRVTFNNASQVQPPDIKDNYYMIIVTDSGLNTTTYGLQLVSRISYYDI